MIVIIIIVFIIIIILGIAIYPLNNFRFFRRWRGGRWELRKKVLGPGAKWRQVSKDLYLNYSSQYRERIIKVEEFRNFFFFLGGNDLEMKEIKILLTKLGINFVNKNLGWGAKASAYEEEIFSSSAQGATPVLIELMIDCDLPPGSIIIDHHGKDAGDASILQVLALLDLQPDHWQQLVAANDSGGFFGLKEFGASPEEIDRVLQADRQVQGFTSEMEQISLTAARQAEKKGDLALVRLPFAQFAAAKAYLWLQGQQNMLFVAEDGSGEVEFQGNGRIAKALSNNFSSLNHWTGGAGLGDNSRYDAFFGCYTNSPQSLIDFVISALS